MLRKILLGCGIVSSLLYVATDILASLRYEGYSYRDQQVSELMAAGAPTRTLLVSLFTPYNLLVAAFAVGVWAAAGRTRTARITGALLIGYAAVGQLTLLFFPMTPRGVEGTLRNDMHGPMTAVMSLFLLVGMGFGAMLLGRRFRWYTYGTIVTLLVFGGLVSTQIGRIDANESTPWMGIAERVNIYATMLWIVVLANALWRVQGANAPGHLGTPAVTRQAVPR
jgi:hypothetical protein